MDIIKNKTSIKSRKEHNCDFCHKVIPKGSLYDNSTIIDNGGIYSWKMHSKCNQISYKLNMYDESYDGVTSELFHEYISTAFENLNVKQSSDILKDIDLLLDV